MDRFENLKRSLSDFALKYPSKDNPANSYHDTVTEISNNNNNNINNNTTGNKAIDDNDRLNQLEKTMKLLLIKIEQKDSKIKKYEEFYRKQKSRADERKNSTIPVNNPNTNNNLPIPIVTVPGSPIKPISGSTTPRRPPTYATIKHPSTSTLENSLQRPKNNFP